MLLRKEKKYFWNFNYRLNNYYFCFCGTAAPLTLNFHYLEIVPAACFSFFLCCEHRLAGIFILEGLFFYYFCLFMCR